MQKQAWGYKEYLEIIPKVTESGSAKFEKMPVRISGALNKLGGTVFRHFESHFKGAFSAKGFFITNSLMPSSKHVKETCFWKQLEKGPEKTYQRPNKCLRALAS